jgi:hypothetical protein
VTEQQIQELLKPIIDARTKEERRNLAIHAIDALAAEGKGHKWIVDTLHQAFRTGHQSYRLTRDDAWECLAIYKWRTGAEWGQEMETRVRAIRHSFVPRPDRFCQMSDGQRHSHIANSLAFYDSLEIRRSEMVEAAMYSRLAATKEAGWREVSADTLAHHFYIITRKGPQKHRPSMEDCWQAVEQGFAEADRILVGGAA